MASSTGIPIPRWLLVSPPPAALLPECDARRLHASIPEAQIEKKQASGRAAVSSTYGIAYALVFIPAFSHAAVLKRVHEALRGCSPGIPRGLEYERVSRR